MNDEYRHQREIMVERQIAARGVYDPAVLEAMRTVPREEFVPGPQVPYAFNDGPLPIGKGQTISQPYIVAYMTELLELKGTERVLELGTGCGYQTAVLAEIVEHVYTIEVIAELAEDAEDRLRRLNYENITFKVGNGRDGWPEFAPFDCIMLTAAPTRFPERLFDQLAVGGIALAPVGDYFQRMIKYRKTENKIESDALIGVSFVPFI